MDSVGLVFDIDDYFQFNIDIEVASMADWLYIFWNIGLRFESRARQIF